MVSPFITRAVFNSRKRKCINSCNTVLLSAPTTKSISCQPKGLKTYTLISLIFIGSTGNGSSERTTMSVCCHPSRSMDLFDQAVSSIALRSAAQHYKLPSPLPMVAAILLIAPQMQLPLWTRSWLSWPGLPATRAKARVKASSLLPPGWR